MISRPGRVPIYDDTTRERLLAQLDQAPPAGIHLDRPAPGSGPGGCQYTSGLAGTASPGASAWPGAGVGVSPRILSSLKRRPILSVSIWPRRTTRWCWPWTKNPAFRPWNVSRVGCGCPAVRRSAATSMITPATVTSTLFAALNVASGQVQAGHYARRRRREFLDFMNEVVAAHAGRELHVVLDNLNTHKPKHDRWLRQHPQVRFYYTPTHTSWLEPSRGVVQHLEPGRPARGQLSERPRVAGSH